MPRLSLWFVRASLVYFLLGFTFGALLLAEKGIPYYPPIWNLLPIHIELLLIGWLLQLAMGVAFWIMPRFGVGAPRGNEGLIWAAFTCVNGGIVLAALQFWLPPALLPGRALEVAGVFLFLAGMWRRVKPMGT
jgi:hypothetical protein